MFRAQSAHHQEVNDANCTYAASGMKWMNKKFVYQVGNNKKVE